jgi:hypothetical protein
MFILAQPSCASVVTVETTKAAGPRYSGSIFVQMDPMARELS